MKSLSDKQAICSNSSLLGAGAPISVLVSCEGRGKKLFLSRLSLDCLQLKITHMPHGHIMGWRILSFTRLDKLEEISGILRQRYLKIYKQALVEVKPDLNIFQNNEEGEDKRSNKVHTTEQRVGKNKNKQTNKTPKNPTQKNHRAVQYFPRNDLSSPHTPFKARPSALLTHQAANALCRALASPRS